MNEKIGEHTGRSLVSISGIRKQLVTEGFEATWNRKKRLLPPTPKKLDGLQETRLNAMR